MRGIGVSKGIGCAPALRYSAGALHIPDGPAGDREEEARRLLAACRRAGAALERGAAQAGGEGGAILKAHMALLEDRESLLEPILSLIREEGKNAAAAAAEQFDRLIGMMEALPDPYLRRRAEDFLDLKDQLLRELLGRPAAGPPPLEGPVVLVARRLTPADTLRLDLSRVAGLVCQEGGENSHAAILARSLGVPAVLGCPGAPEIPDGAPVLLDGGTGEVIINPGPERRRQFAARREGLLAEERELDAYKSRPAQTRDGVLIRLLANVAAPEEVGAAIAAGAEGVGLLRSEFLYLGRDSLPTEEEQFLFYRKALVLAGDRPVTIRTLDAGGDKELPCLGLEREDNPFLGCRAIRLCLDRPELFHTQLRALYRASAYGRLQILFPMVSSLEELRRAKAMAGAAREALAGEGIPFDPGVPLGMMVEVPAAAILADRFAREADFFSIGTNDLVQYTAAADRGSGLVAHLYDPCHPAVLRLIAHTARSAREAGIECCLCGEAAGDPSCIPILAGLGLRQLSMAPVQLPRAKKTICQLTLDQAERLCREIDK